MSMLLCSHQSFSLSATLSSTRQKLIGGELALNDSVGDPKFPAFLYDEDVMDGSFMMGLFHGPLLLAVSLVILEQGGITDCWHLGVHFHLHIAFWCHRCKGVIEAGERKNPWDGERHSVNSLLHCDTCMY